MQKDKIRTYFTPKRIAYLGIMVAISVVTNAFTITFSAFGSNSISFNYVVCSLAGIFFGPISGGIVGLLGDLIGCLIAPKGPFNPFIMLSSMLIGVLAGLSNLIPKIPVYAKILIGYLLIFIVCTCGLNTYGIWLFYIQGKKTFLIYLASRIGIQSIIVTINIVLTYALYFPLKKFVFNNNSLSHKRKENLNKAEEPKDNQ